MTRVLFILKYRQPGEPGPYSDGAPKGLSRGLLNSAKFVRDMLERQGIETKLVQVQDNNGIDREVSLYKPTHVIIEAYWVVPEKFDILKKLHPSVTWIVRNHSELPFLANEGIAIEWTLGYLRRGVVVRRNSWRTNEEMRSLARDRFPEMNWLDICNLVVYLPNYYPVKRVRHTSVIRDNTINIGCFGAIRPLKNHLIQAKAAMTFADEMGVRLRFHINMGRVEGRGEPILKNLRALFRQTHHELVEHGWLPHNQFLTLVRNMDLGMQVRFNESFNIVAADFVGQGVPIVVSPAVSWAHWTMKVDPTRSDSIIWGLWRAWVAHKLLPWWNPRLFGLQNYSNESIRVWTGYFRGKLVNLEILPPVI